MKYAALLLAPFALAACGGADDRTAATETPPPAASQPETQTPETTPATGMESGADMDADAGMNTDDGMQPDAGMDTAALTPTGWGDLQIGMTLDEVTQAVGPDANPDAVGGAAPATCDEFHPENAPDGMMVMITDGTLGRISLGRDSSVKTDAGIGLGDGPDAIKAAYGDEAVASPNKYVPAPAQDFTVWTAGDASGDYVEDPDARGIRYEVDKTGKVSIIHAGGPSIQYVEGCS